MSRPTVTVVLPAYNEEAVIGKTLDRVVSYLESVTDRYEWDVLVINDGSTDRTGQIISEYAARHPRVTALHHSVNLNLGQTLRYAFSTATGDTVVTLDSDLSYGPEHIGALVDAKLQQQAKVVVGSPYAKGGQVTSVPRRRQLLSRAANRLLGLTAKGRLTTVTGMARAYDRKFLQGLDLKAWDFEINTEIIYKAQILRAHIVEIPAHLDWTEQAALGAQRTSSLRVARGVASQAFSSFLFRPFAFFIIPGLVVLLLAGYALMWSAWHAFEAWREPGVRTLGDAIAASFDRSPHSFVVGGIALLVAIQLVSLGILSMQNKRYFEELFHLGTTVYRQHQGLRPLGLPDGPTNSRPAASKGPPAGNEGHLASTPHLSAAPSEGDEASTGSVSSSPR